MAPDVAAERHARDARAQGVAHLLEQAVLIGRAVSAENHDRHRGALDDAAHAVRVAGVEGLDVVGAHFGGLPTHTGNVLWRMFFGLVEAAWDDLGLEGNTPALADEGVTLERRPLATIAAAGEDLDRVRAQA